MLNNPKPFSRRNTQEMAVLSQRAYKIDLSRIDGEGDFPCPRCGVIISPEDETEKTYSILETRSEEGALKEIMIACNICGSIIHLRGFEECNCIDEELEAT